MCRNGRGRPWHPIKISIYCLWQFDMPPSGLDMAATSRGLDMRRSSRRVVAEKQKTPPPSGRGGHFERSREIPPITFQIHLFRTMPPRRMGRWPRAECAAGEGDNSDILSSLSSRATAKDLKMSIYCLWQFDMPLSGLDMAATSRGLDMRRQSRRVMVKVFKTPPQSAIN